jgi:hypothetical protein
MQHHQRFPIFTVVQLGCSIVFQAVIFLSIGPFSLNPLWGELPPFRISDRSYNASTCTIAMVILTTDQYLDHPFPFNSSVCPISHRFIFLRTGTASDSSRTFTTSRDRTFSDGYIVRAGFNASDLFALALTLYFPASLSLTVDFERFDRFDGSWIDRAASQLLFEGAAAVAARVTGGLASHALLTRTEVLRHFLSYTDVHYSSVPSLAAFSLWAGDVAECKGSHVFAGAPAPSAGAAAYPLHCPAPRPGSDVAVVLPAFKRDYMEALVGSLVRQIQAPTRIFFLQNRMHVLLNFSAIRAAARGTPVCHVWCTNWNSFFYLTYVLVMFLPERFVVKIDDDNIPIDRTGIRRFVKAAVPRNSIVGRGGAAIGKRWCRLRPKVAPPTEEVDHVSWVVLFDPRAAKVMNRFRWQTKITAEDVALSLGNALECGTKSLRIPFKVQLFQADGKTQAGDREIMSNWPKNHVDPFASAYCHIVFAGYRPVRWINFSIPVTVNLRLPHELPMKRQRKSTNTM